jgi:hypothetical protein
MSTLFPKIIQRTKPQENKIIYKNYFEATPIII